MCLAIPGKILDIENVASIRRGRIQFGAVTREANLDLVPEANPGEYVLVHAGFAIRQIDAEDAARTFELLERLAAAEDAAESGI